MELTHSQIELITRYRNEYLEIKRDMIDRRLIDRLDALVEPLKLAYELSPEIKAVVGTYDDAINKSRYTTNDYRTWVECSSLVLLQWMKWVDDFYPKINHGYCKNGTSFCQEILSSVITAYIKSDQKSKDYAAELERERYLTEQIALAKEKELSEKMKKKEYNASLTWWQKFWHGK